MAHDVCIVVNADIRLRQARRQPSAEPDVAERRRRCRTALGIAAASCMSQSRASPTTRRIVMRPHGGGQAPAPFSMPSSVAGRSGSFWAEARRLRMQMPKMAESRAMAAIIENNLPCMLLKEAPSRALVNLVGRRAVRLAAIIVTISRAHLSGVACVVDGRVASAATSDCRRRGRPSCQSPRKYERMSSTKISAQ